ncbi:MAG: DUF58 domain-containing protein [Burkholderiaceae bacterium]|jgi:uncharacterized protein (DUF58 family)|nr:DUF58 domain-containing protein [Burkholderiaceae bacterium]
MSVTLDSAAPPWWAWRARLRAWWLERMAAADSITLVQRRVYILPTHAGLLLTATLAVLLIASINYQLNLGYLLTFLLAGCAAAGMAVCHGNLRGLTLQAAPPQPVFAGSLALLDVRLINARRRARLAIGLARYGVPAQRGQPIPWAWADVPGQGEAALRISWLPPRRGLWPVPPLTVETRYPLGTFRVWAVWRPAARVLVYPAPETPCPPLPRGQPVAGAGPATSARASGEFDGVRAYRRGDPMKLLVWKKYARSGELIARDTQTQQRQALWLDFARTGALAPEQRLSRLTAWVLAADAQGLDYGLRLPGLDIVPANGSAQRLRCLEALAKC